MEGWESGHVVADRYRLEEPIGSGGMGMVWRAEHIKLRSPVAIKVLPKRVASDDIRSARFIREAQAAAAIRSTNVVQVLDYGVDDGIAYIAMEYLEGESLADRLDRKLRLSPRETLRVITQVAKAIARAHKKGIIHRDLKPANIFIAMEEDDVEVVKVLDFGIAKLTNKKQGTDQTTQTGYLLGTPNYMSPEQTRGHKVVDQRADIWSLAIVAFECLCGERPIDGETVGDIIYKICSEEMPKPSSVAPVPIGFDRWFRKATRKDPAERYQSAKEMALALADAMGDVVPFSDPDSLDSVDSFDRQSIELSDTLAAKRRSQQAPASRDAPATTPSYPSRDEVTIDSWDTTGDPVRPSETQISGPPPDTGDVSPVEVGIESAADAGSADSASANKPQSSTAGVAVGESLRASTRTFDDLRAPGGRRWPYAVLAAVVVGGLLYMTVGSSTAVPTSASSLATASSEVPVPLDSSAPDLAPTSPPVDAATADPSAEPSAEVAPSASVTAPKPAPRRAAPRAPKGLPKPLPPKPTPDKPPASGSGKIDFGI